ncbi:MAG: ATP-dependent helicase HrpB [Steroidobacteraceae bacterium]
MLLPELPITASLPAIGAALRRSASAILVAPPGAGKSTLVPLALLGEPWAKGRRIIMLEPRRLAARSLAARMARLLRVPLGGQIGYRTRLDTRVGKDTRIEVVTEGVLTRMLQTDPALEGVAAVLFDEFHERSLQCDLALALALDARRELATDLRIVVMSATLALAALRRILPDAEVIESTLQEYEVAMRYVGTALPLPTDDWPLFMRALQSAVGQAWRETAGDVLVFLPGGGEIRALQNALGDAPFAAEALVLPLYGELDTEAQDRVLERSGTARRIILATNIAQTSLTIPGIGAVVDCGLVRRMIFDPASGMGRLHTERISQAAATQRAGRAGRVADGVCYRMWSAGAQQTLAAQTAPEIAVADLTPLALELLLWGVDDPSRLDWVDVPPPAQLAAAMDLLAGLGMVDSRGRITVHGRNAAHSGAHPRLAHMMLEAASRGDAPLGAELAALLEMDRRGNRQIDAHVRTDIGVVLEWHRRNRAAELRQQSQRLLRRLGAHETAAMPAAAGDATGALLSLAFPDRIARRRDGSASRYLLASGRGASLPPAQSIARNEYLVAVELDGGGADAGIRLAAPLSEAMLRSWHRERITERQIVRWDREQQMVVARAEVRLDALTLEERKLDAPAGDEVLAAMLDGLRQLGVGALPWTPALRQWQARVAFLRRHRADDGWPDVSDTSLRHTLGEWLAPWLDGMTRAAHLAQVPLKSALQSLIGPELSARMDSLAPTHFLAPTGSRSAIDYSDPEQPVVALRLQELFGLEAGPRLAGGTCPLGFVLLSPAQRPIQITRDLAGFWRSGYFDVRKEMRGRYPRHAWPEDPLAATPTRGARRRS